MPIELDDVSFAYKDGSLAVENVSMRIEDGERVAIVGQNGAGKTTTVKMMNGLLKPTIGVVRVNGEPTAKRSTASVARDVGYVFQNPDDQIFAATVLGELEYMPRYLKWDETRTRARTERAARLVAIEDVLDVNPSDLPFAIRKFVAIGAILVSECRFIILDEPTAGLDQHGIAILNDLLTTLESEGVGIVTITHDMRFVVEQFDRVIVMANRRVVADGPTEEVFADSEVLAAARLRRPDAAQIAHDLGLGPHALRIADIVDAVVGAR